jgi:hypothetical protein
MTFRGDATPYQDLLRSIATEGMGHVEQITNTINMLLDGASNSSSQPDDIPLSVALDSPNIHHFLVAVQSARPVDAAVNPWSASYVYDASYGYVLNMRYIYIYILRCAGLLFFYLFLDVCVRTNTKVDNIKYPSIRWILTNCLRVNGLLHI